MLNDPEMMLEQHYQNVQNELKAVRKAHQKSLERICKLESAKEKGETKGLELADLEKALQSEKENRKLHEETIRDLEEQVQKAYTKKQMLIARDKAAQARRASENPMTEQELRRRSLMFAYFVVSMLILYAIAQGLNNSR